MHRLSLALLTLLIAGCSVVSVDLTPQVRPLREETVEGRGFLATVRFDDVPAFEASTTVEPAAASVDSSADIPLASRCLRKGAIVLDQRGGAFTEDNIGAALANRELLSHLRDLGTLTGGPLPFSARDRSRFLHRLDEAIRAVRRRNP